MAVPRSGILWRRIFVVLLVAAVIVYAWLAGGEFPHGGSPIGLTYGIAGFALILLLAFFGIRKRWYRSTFGTLEQWMQSHIYLGLLVMVILLLHTGGRFHDRIAVTALALLAIVVVSGIAGAILYATIPRLLTEVESNLSMEEISDQINQLSRSMGRTASDRSAAFQMVFHELMRETVPGWLAGWRLLFLRLRRTDAGAGRDWSGMVALVPREEQEDLRQMLVVVGQRRELMLRLLYQQKYKNILEAWLWVHVPFTFALLIFSILHIAAAFYYGAVSW